MKIAERVGTRLAAWGTVMAVALGATTLGAASDHQGFAKVRYVVGNAGVTKGGGAAAKVERYMVLHPGDTVKTEPTAHVDLMLGFNNGSFQVGPGSEVKLEKLTYRYTGLEVTHDTQLDLKKGFIGGVANRMAKGSKYEVKTPRGIAGIRGTRYGVWDNGNVGAIAGNAAMALSMPDGSIKTVPIPAGQILVAATAQVRPLTKEERDLIEGSASDALTHGGYLRDEDPASRQFFEASQEEPYVSPIGPQ